MKNSVSAVIRYVGMLFNPCAFKSVNSIDRIHQIIMCASLHSNPLHNDQLFQARLILVTKQTS